MGRKVKISIFAFLILLFAMILFSNTSNADTKQRLAWTSMSNGYFAYTGEQIRPKIKVYSSSSDELIKGTDYKVKYKNNIEVGTARIIITGIGNYEGTLERTFEIKYDLSNANVSDIPDQEYTGQMIKPEPTKVKVNGVKLKKDVDYTLNYYSNNNITQIGQNGFSITGKGNYMGYKYVQFKVVPVRVNKVAAGIKYNQIKVRWKQVTNTDFDGYTIYRADSKNGSTSFTQLADVDSTKTVYWDSTANSTGTTYYYKVLTYKNNYGTKVYSQDSNIASAVYVQTVKAYITSYTNKSWITWDKVSGATAYQVFRSTSSDGTYTKVKVLKGDNNTGWADKSVEPAKKYYYKVRCYVAIGDEIIRGSFSNVLEKAALGKTKLKNVNYNGSSISISWNQVDGAGGYKVYRATSKNGKYKKVANLSSSSLNYIDNNINPGYVYFYKVNSYNGKSFGQESDIKYAITGNRIDQLKRTYLEPDETFKQYYSSAFDTYKNIINKATSSDMNTYKKVKALYYYVVRNMYHKDGYHCKNFAGTFAGICRTLGLDAYCTTGQTQAAGGGYTAHTWTIININGTEYIFDASLDRHRADRMGTKTSDYYFFKTYDELPNVYKPEGNEYYWPYFMVYLD